MGQINEKVTKVAKFVERMPETDCKEQIDLKKLG